MDTLEFHVIPGRELVQKFGYRARIRLPGKNSGLVGTEQKRYFELAGGRLTLKTPPLTVPGEAQVHRLVWERLG